MRRYAVRPGSAGIVARLVVCVVESWRWALSCGVVFSGGLCLLDSGGLSKPACGETQEEHLGNLILRKGDVDDDGASCGAASTRTSHSLSSSGSRIWTCRLRAINNLATPQVRKDTPSLIDVKGLERPKEFTGREEDFQQWSKKTEAFFAGVIKESQMRLEWAAEQATDITTTAIDLEFLPTDTKVDRGVPNLEFVVQQMHAALLAPADIVANSRKNPFGGMAETAEAI